MEYEIDTEREIYCNRASNRQRIQGVRRDPVRLSRPQVPRRQAVHIPGCEEFA